VNRLAPFLAAVWLAIPPLLSAQPTRTEVQRTSGIIELGGVPCPYLLEGEGVPCIVVGPSFFYSQFFSDDLKQHIQFVLVDFKNTWRADTTVDVSQVTMADLVDELDEVRRALGFERICVIGASVLGYWSLEYAKAYPDRISHAIMIGTPPHQLYDNDDFWQVNASEERKAMLQRNWERMPEEEIDELAPQDRFPMSWKNMAPIYWYDPGYDPYWHIAGRPSFDIFGKHVFEVLLPGYDPRETFSGITAPVFLALGRYDYSVPHTLWEEAKDLLPNLSYHVFDKSAHFPMFEEPELFDKELVEWLERHPR
jgi:proline iminopeptidase